MKKEECIIGAIVFTDDGLLYRYEVKSLPDEKDEVLVKPTKDSWAGSEESFHLDDLYLLDLDQIKELGVKVQSKLDEAASAFEAAFNAYKEAEQLADERHSLYSLQEDNVVSMEKLENVIESHGWSMSSFRC